MIFIDTWVWMEFLGKTKETKKAQDIIEITERKAISTSVIAELRYHSIKNFGLEKTESITQLIESNESIAIIPLTREIAKMTADLRLKYYNKKRRDLSFVDCINLATAILSGCGKFYTGDPDFDGIDEIEIKNIRKPIIKTAHIDKENKKENKNHRKPDADKK